MIRHCTLFGIMIGLQGMLVFRLRLHHTHVLTPSEWNNNFFTSAKIRKSNDNSLSTPLSGSNSTRSGRVHFRHFTGDPQHHNKSVTTGESLPGPFFNEQLFLIGARLTTSYIQNVSDVHFDVFGFPGDWVSPGPRDGLSPNLVCDITKQLKNWSFASIKNITSPSSGRLYCQLECNQKDHSELMMKTRGDECGHPIEMKLIPLKSGDGNQQGTTFIWRCNVTKYLQKSDIMTQVAARNGKQSSVRIRLLWYGNETHGLREEPFDKSQVTELEIPLHTAVVGHGGPQIRSRDHGYFSSTNNEKSMQVGICLSIYGDNPSQYLPEFVQHHKNIGFQQIVIGVETTMGSNDLSRAEAILRPYIDEGFVVLQATGLKTFFNCTVEIQKLHFYHQCLYHFKGLSKYIGIWDLDEYWLPPDRSKKFVDNYKSIPHHEGFSGTNPYARRVNNITVNQPFSNFFVSRHPLVVPSDRVTSDPLWQGSNYTTALSIQATMEAIEKSYDDIGCKQRWCYHLFPSYSVHAKKGITRTGRIGNDFYKRIENSTRTWKKSIVQTRYAMMGGFHVSGSCQYPDDPEFYVYAAEPECLPQLWDMGDAGSIHHFGSLVLYSRERPYLESDVVDDEYLMLYAQTVSMQLDRYNMTLGS